MDEQRHVPERALPELLTASGRVNDPVRLGCQTRFAGCPGRGTRRTAHCSRQPPAAPGKPVRACFRSSIRRPGSPLRAVPGTPASADPPATVPAPG